MTLSVLKLIKSGEHRNYLLRVIEKTSKGKKIKYYTDLPDVIELIKNKEEA